MPKNNYNDNQIYNYWRSGGLVLLPNLSFIDSHGSINEPSIDTFKIVSLSDWVIGLSASGYRDIPEEVIALMCTKFTKLPEMPGNGKLLCCMAKKGSEIVFIPWGNMICLWANNQCSWVTRSIAQDRLGGWGINFALVQKYLSEVKKSPEKQMPGKAPTLISKVKK